MSGFPFDFRRGIRLFQALSKGKSRKGSSRCFKPCPRKRLMLSAGSSKETGRRETPGRQNMLQTNPPGGMRRAKKPRCLNSCHDIRSGKNGFPRIRPRRKTGQTRRKTFRQADSGTSKTRESLTRPRSRLSGNNREHHGAKPSEQTPEKKRRRHLMQQKARSFETKFPGKPHAERFAVRYAAVKTF